MIKVFTVIGNRPEAIKLAPVIRAFNARDGKVEHCTCVAAQESEYLEDVLEAFAVKPDYELDVAARGKLPADVMPRVLECLTPILRAERPDWVVVQGDATTAMAAALSATYNGIGIAHVEAGLRSFDRTEPFPEETNRILISSMARLHFAPTPAARANLIAHGVDPNSIYITGNTGMDAFFDTLDSLSRKPVDDAAQGIPHDRLILLVTVDRRENHGVPLRSICHGLFHLATRHVKRLKIVFPVHPDPAVRETVHSILGHHPGVRLLPPLDYRQHVYLMRRSHFIMTDSGGIQEEAPALGKPVLILRDVTERSEGILSGNTRLIGTHHDRVFNEASRLVLDRREYAAMANPCDLYGDGSAARRIVSVLLGEPIAEWLPRISAIQ